MHQPPVVEQAQTVGHVRVGVELQGDTDGGYVSLRALAAEFAEVPPRPAAEVVAGGDREEELPGSVLLAVLLEVRVCDEVVVPSQLGVGRVDDSRNLVPVACAVVPLLASDPLAADRPVE